MWGNLLGWIISFVMLAATTGALVVMAMPPSESRAAGLIPLAFQPVALPIDPTGLVTPATKDCDAADIYRDAIDLYSRNPEIYEKAATTDVSNLPAVQKVVEANDCSHMTLFTKNPGNIINYDNDEPWLRALLNIGQAASNVGLSMKADKKYDEAQKYYHAAFALGEKMFKERVGWQEMNIGMSIMSMAAEGMARLADDRNQAARADGFRAFQEKLDSYHRELQEKVATPLGNADENYAAKFAGDIFAVAKSPTAERAWRVEAILHIGRYRLNVASNKKGDQDAAIRELILLEGSPDPIIQAAAKTAQKLTSEQQQNTGSPSQ